MVLGGTNEEVLKGKETVKGRWGEYFTGLLNENNEREAALDYLGRGEVKSVKAEE